MTSAYSETLLEHFQSPRNTGVLESPDAEATGENPVCGDRLRVQLRVRDGIISEVKWQAEGCAPCLAAASVASEMVRGMPVRCALDLDADEIARALGGLPPRKEHAATLFVRTLRQALKELTSATQPRSV